MRRRNWFAVTAVTVASFVVGVGGAVADATKTGTGTASTKPIKLNCKVSLTTMPPQGDNAVNQPAVEGSQYGPVNCRPFGAAGFGGGIIADAFTVPDTGDTVGIYTQYFKAGTVTGRFDLTPQESNFSTASFTSQSWQGTVKVMRGTGVYKGIKQKKLGTLTCTSQDSVHLSCVEKIKLKTL